MLTIDALGPGTPARLARIGGNGGFRRRLLEMGFLPGTAVRVVRRVDIGGLIEVELRGCRISLRNSEAHRIVVEPVTP
jgi:Fe2+ transport system protein FeoA